MMKRLGNRLRRVLTGSRLLRAIDRHERAADELDALLREVLDHD